MEPNSVTRRLRRGEPRVGTMVFEFNTAGIGHLAARGGGLRHLRHGAGIVVPMAESGEAATDWLTSLRYPPLGRRALQPCAG
jgi:hypothetical protein